jgi:hypothetical protein
MPILSTPEHIRYGLALYLSILAANALTLLVIGPGWRSIIIWGMSALIIFLISEEVTCRWARQHQRSFATRKEWNAARQAAQRSWPLTITCGFLWGFVVTGGVDMRHSTMETQDWITRLMAGVIGAIVWVLFSWLWCALRAR